MKEYYDIPITKQITEGIRIMSDLGASIAQKASISTANNIKHDLVLKMLKDDKYTLRDIIYLTDFSEEKISKIKKEIAKE